MTKVLMMVIIQSPLESVKEMAQSMSHSIITVTSECLDSTGKSVY
jgi:hypothetical protein